MLVNKVTSLLWCVHMDSIGEEASMLAVEFRDADLKTALISQPEQMAHAAMTKLKAHAGCFQWVIVA